MGQKIVRLNETVINQIAAGEVVRILHPLLKS